MPIRLTQPTDFLILDLLSDGKRDTGSNIAKRIDKNRSYINTRLPVLADYDLIDKIGPHESSGLYQITPLGVAAVQKQALYDQDQEQFDAAIRELAADIEIEGPTIIQKS
ncbi:ArsR family transcriptional regulator [Halobellus inordinatus]|uniref:ArsR family transcriptional regulator n=1 Tax=Halobellus inordinatus TaxID=1126236 RepID=UPI002114356B|nr:ArsR family transcriptional regulator [Halobellus ramosii]